MAANDVHEPPREAINLHNRMVFELSRRITKNELRDLKYLFQYNPLTEVDINNIETVQDLFTLLKNKMYIDFGDYKNFLTQLENINPDLCSIVNKCTEDIGKIIQQADIEGMVISMDKTKYHASEGSTAYIYYTVDHAPDRITWKRGNERPPLSTRIPIDNRKYYSGFPKAPTLVIKKSSKSKDEAHYQCSAKAKSKAVDGEIVHLEVSDEGKSNATTTGSTKYYNSPSKSGLSTAVGHEVSQQENEGMVIPMDKRENCVTEGSAVFLTCTMNPGPDILTWYRKHEGSPRKLIPIDQHTFLLGESSFVPSLMIKQVTKAIDEGRYQYSAKVDSTVVDGEIVHLKVYSDDDYGQPPSSKSSSGARGSPPLKNTDPTAEMHSQYIGTQVPTNVIDVHEKESNYKKIMEKKMETQTIKLTFIGHARAGKTCLMRQLLRERIEPGGPDRTNLAELLTKRLRYTLRTSAKEKEKLEEGKEAELCRLRLRRLRKRREDTGMTLIYQRNDLLNEDLNADIGHHLNDDEDYSDHSEEESSPVIHKRKTNHMTENQRNAIEDINKEDDSIDDSSVAYVTLFDFGGDEVFRNYHYSLMSANSIYLLVFDASLWENPDNQDQIIDEIEYWLNSVATYAKDESDDREGRPPIILIGSHMDKVTKNENEICDTIWAKLQEKIGIKDIYNHHVQQIICVADMHNSRLNKEKYLEVWCEIEKCVHLQSCWQDNIAGCWLALEEKLMLEKEKGIKFLNIQQILDINSELLVPLEENEIVPFLRYMHNAASIFCFNIFGKTDSEFLTEQDKKQIKVILDINWLIKAFGAIITDDKFVAFPGHKQRHVWENYKTTAMLTNEVLELLWSNVTHDDCEVLISQMKYLGLITEQTPQRYIVPCLLGEAELDCIQQILNNESVHFTKTLCLVFHYQFVPQVIWDTTVTFCLRKFSECTSTYQKRGNERINNTVNQSPKRGFVCRNVDDIWNFVLHCRGAMLKLTMFNHHEQPVNPGVGQNLRLKIEDIVKNVLSMANQGHRMFNYYLHCDFWIHDGESHVGKPKIETMRKCSKYRVEDARGNRCFLTQDDSNAWFGDVSKVSAEEKFTDMTRVKIIHAAMVTDLQDWIYPTSKNKWETFQTNLEPYLADADLYDVPDNSMAKICRKLMRNGKIEYGDYSILRKIVISIDVRAADVIDKAVEELSKLSYANDKHQLDTMPQHKEQDL